MVARLVRDQEVVGSSPVTSTKYPYFVGILTDFPQNTGFFFARIKNINENLIFLGSKLGSKSIKISAFRSLLADNLPKSAYIRPPSCLFC